MIRRRKKNLKAGKLNLVPILDAVFIFIFFLLTSSNFLNIFEIATSAPVIAEDSPPPEKPPLQLTLKVSSEKIEVLTFSTRQQHAVFTWKEKEELLTTLKELKEKYPHEEVLILEPQEEMNYEKIITLIDYTREPGSEIFPQLVFGNL